jgi:hypothetical protein
MRINHKCLLLLLLLCSLSLSLCVSLVKNQCSG